MASHGISGTPRSRSRFVIGVLVLTTALVGLLAYQALDAARLHRGVAERTLVEHAEFAAWEFSSALRRDLSTKALKDGLEVAARSEAKYTNRPLSSFAFADSLASLWEWPHVGEWHYLFRVDLVTGEVSSVGRETPTAAERGWLRDSLAVHGRSAYDNDWEMGTVIDPAADEGDGRAFVYRYYPKTGADAEVMYGYRADMAAWHDIFEGVAEHGAVLPPAVTAGKPTNELMTLSIVGDDGSTLFSSAPTYASAYAATDTIGSGFPGLTVGVVLRPDVAETVLIGGLPRSRLPELLALLIATLGLIGAAIVQLRRENELAQLRIDFVSGVSHELRTPLAQIRMFAETLALGRVRNEDERKRSLDIIVKEARRLTNQVDNVLLFSRAERRVVELNLRPDDLSQLLLDFRESFGPVAEAAGARLRVAVLDGVWARVDPVAFPQAVYNLLDNAVKYGPKGQTIGLSLERSKGRIRIVVDDEGPGVPEADRERIWDAYHRLRRDRDSAISGSGIGLAVVKEVINLHGGRVWTEQGPAGGRFVVELPAFAPDAKPVPGDEATDSPLAARA